MKIDLPNLCLVLLVGPSGAGKSTFARKHFLPTECVSSDVCRGLVCDDESSLEFSKQAFELVRFIAGQRLALGKLTVIDSTNVHEDARAEFVRLARDYDVLPVAIVLNEDEDTCIARNKLRPDRQFGEHVVRLHCRQMRRSIRHLKSEGFRHTFVLNPSEIAEATISRVPLWNDRKSDHGPFDIVGDVHGCYDELVELIDTLGYAVSESAEGPVVTAPAGRKLIFLGDLCDRGPKSPQVLRLVMSAVKSGAALCVPGNHDVKLLKHFQGKKVTRSHGLDLTIEQLEEFAGEYTGRDFSQQAAKFLDGLVSHYVLDGGRLVVAHAGIKESYIGRSSGRVREFCLYGDTTGETDEYGLPVRLDWAAEYRGKAAVVYGHTPVAEADWLNNTINIDTGCVFGGKLSALRWPERTVHSVPCRQAYAEPGRPFLVPQRSIQHENDDLLDLDDVLGRRAVETRLASRVTIREANAVAALEVMSRFAVDPHWLVYLPPTMSPCATSEREGLLEHPEQAISYFREAGVTEVIAEEKHMGSRAVAIVCQDAAAGLKHFGVEGDGVIYTRTGRRFFDNLAVEAELLSELRTAISAADLWTELGTSFFVLDCELMPWSAKAQELLKLQYAPVGAASTAALRAESVVVAAGLARCGDDPILRSLAASLAVRQDAVQRYTKAYREYCWPVSSVGDLRLAPFHVLATEGATHVERDHLWHMDIAARMVRAGSGVLMATEHRTARLDDATACDALIAWWETKTTGGGEGAVFKPREFVHRGPRGLTQPAVKCRGPEYLRIIYGPEYTVPANLQRLRKRALNGKRTLAIREFALGVEGLERFARKEPLRRVHECVFGVLAMESEPIDPRL